MRADLRDAMKDRRTVTVSALRTALAAIDNAEALTVAEGVPTDGSQHVAGALAGIGAAEADRRVLSLAEVRAVLGTQIAEYLSDADHYRDHETAQRLRRRAQLLQRYTG